MTEDWKARAAYFREKAQGMRAMAADMHHADTRAAMECAAADYERLAKAAEKMAEPVSFEGKVDPSV